MTKEIDGRDRLEMRSYNDAFASSSAQQGRKEVSGLYGASGWLNKRSEALLRVVPVALAGGGPVTQTIQIDQWLQRLSEQNNHIPVRRIGVASQAGLADERVIGKIYDLDRIIPASSSISDIYDHVSSVIADELDYLYSTKKIRHFTCVCCGYTSYGLFALKRAITRLNTAHPDDVMTANVMIQDSSFPDVDTLSTDLDERGCPSTRFYGPAYVSTPDVRIVFTLNGALPFDVRLSKRTPAGCTHLMTTFPFTDEYVEFWQAAGKQPKLEARKRLERFLPGLVSSEASDWVVPLVASGGCWDEQNVGRWMTQRQFESMVQGTLTIVRALQYVAERSNKRIFLLLSGKGADVIREQQIADTATAIHMAEALPADNKESRSAATTILRAYEKLDMLPETGVIILPDDGLPHIAAPDLITGADLVINRTVQANSFAETLLARVPQVVVTMPAEGYMEAELMAQGMKQGLLSYDEDVTEMGAELYSILTDLTYRNVLVNGLLSTFSSMLSNAHANFGAVLAQVAGLQFYRTQADVTMAPSVQRKMI